VIIYFTNFILLLIMLLTSTHHFWLFKDRVHCFSTQVIINKCFLLNPEKKIDTDSTCRFREKRKKHTLIPKNDVEGYATLITSKTVNRLKVRFRLQETMVSESLKLSFDRLTAFSLVIRVV